MRPSRPSVVLRNGCKINLFLRVGERLPNGYHTIESLFLPLEEPHDDLEIRLLAPGAGVRSRVSFYQAGTPERPLPSINPDRNTLTRALAWHAEQTGFAPALDIRVRKGIPQGAGLGGGSANAAALLDFLQDCAEQSGVTPLPRERLIREAAAVGADVPFFLLNRPALASGVGERLIPADNPFAGRFLLLLCPAVEVSTAWAFAALDSLREQMREAARKNASGNLTTQARQAIKPLAQARDCVNDFEAVVFTRFPELAVLHDRLVNSGAEVAHMSGTGSALFALYREENSARANAKRLASDGHSVYIQRLPAG